MTLWLISQYSVKVLINLIPFDIKYLNTSNITVTLHVEPVLHTECRHGKNYRNETDFFIYLCILAVRE